MEAVSIPRSVTRVAGCDCPGTLFHSAACSLWRLPAGQRRAAVADSQAVG